MNRAWITGLTVASVAGTGGVAFATMTASTSPAAAAPTPLAAAEATTAARGYSFQAGSAGHVNLTADDGALTVDSTAPSAGWLVVSYSGPGTHVEVQLGDGTQIVTFAADLVNGEVIAGISSTPVPTVPTVPAVTPAPTPAPAVPVVVLQPSAEPPASSHTSSPSSGGEDEDHEDESEDHEDEDEDGDD